MLVLFGKFAPGEIIVETLQGRPRQAFRRFGRRPVLAKLGGQNFHICYHTAREIRAAMHPCFRLARRMGIGIAVPPSAAEPWISGHPRLLKLLSYFDTVASRRLAALGDHVLYQFQRTTASAP
jgi:hypothetical protein